MLGLQIDPREWNIVVENDRNRNRLGHAAIVIHHLTWRGGHIVGRHDQKRIRASLFGMPRQLNGELCGDMMRSGYHRNPACICLQSSLEHTLSIIDFE